MAMSKIARDIRQPALCAIRKQRVTITVAMAFLSTGTSCEGKGNNESPERFGDWLFTSIQSASPECQALGTLLAVKLE